MTDGIYRYICHPQYTGLFLITFGMLCEWATLPRILGPARQAASRT